MFSLEDDFRSVPTLDDDYCTARCVDDDYFTVVTWIMTIELYAVWMTTSVLYLPGS